VFDRSKPDGTMRKRLMDVSRLADMGWRAPAFRLKDGLREIMMFLAKERTAELNHSAFD